MNQINVTYSDKVLGIARKKHNKYLLKKILYHCDVHISIDTPFTKLRKMKFWQCRGEMSSFLTQAAPFLTSLELCSIERNYFVDKAFKNLKVLVMREYVSDICKDFCKEIDITRSPLLERGGSLGEFGSKIKRTWYEGLGF